MPQKKRRQPARNKRDPKRENALHPSGSNTKIQSPTPGTPSASAASPYVSAGSPHVPRTATKPASNRMHSFHHSERTSPIPSASPASPHIDTGSANPAPAAAQPEDDDKLKEWRERRNRRKEIAPTASDDEDDVVVESDKRTHGSYIMNDGYVRRDHNALWKALWAFVQAHFGFDVGGGEEDAKERAAVEQDKWLRLKGAMSEELVKVAGIVAVGGPGGEAGWKELFVDSPEWRVMLVAGIVWRMLKEHVFHDLVFGGTVGMERECLDAMWGNRHLDGFARQMDRAHLVQGMCDDPFEEYGSNQKNGLPVLFGERVDEVTKGLWYLLRPILAMDPAYPDRELVAEQLVSLREIVVKAGHLSLVMRINPHSLYHFPLNPKDELFDDVGYVVMNNAMMRATNPLFTTEYDPYNGMDEKKMQEEYGKSALVRVAVGDALMVYRQGGWWGVNVDEIGKEDDLEEKKKKETAKAGKKKAKAKAKGKGKGKEKAVDVDVEDEGEDNEFEDIYEKGFRTRRLARAKVGLRWGYQRKFGDKAGVMDEGFQELRDVVGMSA
ncbi:hypothetical protein NA57DRAFT_74463 [Rhizodiscina lignyota]|uniref:Uncharacterized protein n=1 Tax=Rhizodiscina lignyota TaxID=1504668 RepID=A0A9P4IK91_9PEZI|nr:hypothetical protein NA57DRAFT_74463 [Rhizodiscina lignyota]